MTAQSLYNLFLRHKKNLGDVSPTLFLDWVNEINRFAYRIMFGTDPERFMGESTLNVTPGVSSYALPATFENMSTKGCGLYLVQNGIATNQKLPITGFGSQDKGFYIKGGNIIMTPMPGVSEIYTERFIPLLIDLTSLNDSLAIPDEYIYYAKYALDVLWDIWDEDPSSEGTADMRFARALDELARNLNKDSKTTGINTYSNAFY